MSGGSRRPEAGVGTEREPADARLALGAAGAWCVLLLCHGRAVSTMLAAAALCLAIGVVALFVARERQGAWPAVALVAFCALVVVLPAAGREAVGRAGPIPALAAARAAVTAELQVTADPRPLAAQGPGGTPRVSVETRSVVVLVRGRSVRASATVVVLAPADAWRGVLPGQRVRLDGKLQPSLDDPTSATLFAQSAPMLLGNPPWWQRAAGRVRASLRSAVSGLPVEVRGLLPGLVDGDTQDLDPALREHFRLAGLTHLVAVSGTNCSLLLGTAMLFMQRLGVRPRLRAVVGVVVLIAFVVVARPSPSVLRAAGMAGVTLAALSSGRPHRALPSLAAAVLVLLLWQPRLANDLGFTLSVLATAALLLIAPRWAQSLRRRRIPAGIAESVAVATAAHVVTAPVIAAMSGQVSVVAVPANVLAEPVVGVATIAGFAAAVIAPWWLTGARVLAWIASWPCRWLVHVADFFGGLHGAIVPWPAGMTGGLLLTATAISVVWLLRFPRARRVILAAALAAAAVQIPGRALLSQWPATGWFFVACDIGQGDGLVLNAGPGTAVVVDTGPDPVQMDRCLTDLGVHDVALLVLTHFHLDHVGGIAGVFHGRRVGRVITSPLQDPDSGVGMVKHELQLHGLSPSVPAVGESFTVGRLRLDLLAPVVPFHDTRSDPNNSSLTFVATVAGHRVLLTGDDEIDAQRAILRTGMDVRADVLKVPHHGSAYFDPDFLASVRASVGVISVGLHNDYGHPSPRLLDELSTLGMAVFRTDRDGDVALTSHGGRIGTVVRGTAGSTVGLGLRPPPRPVWAVSELDDRIAPCQPAPCQPMRWPTSCAPSCFWSVTRNYWSAERFPLPRAPPVERQRILSRRNSPAPTSRAVSSTNSWVPRSSATPV